MSTIPSTSLREVDLELKKLHSKVNDSVLELTTTKQPVGDYAERVHTHDTADITGLDTLVNTIKNDVVSLRGSLTAVEASVTAVEKSANQNVAQLQKAVQDTENALSLDPLRTLVSTADGKVSASTITADELNCLAGIRTSIQTQLDALDGLRIRDGDDLPAHAPSAHTHPIAQIDGLQTLVDSINNAIATKAATTVVDDLEMAKADKVHSHALADITGLTQKFAEVEAAVADVVKTSGNNLIAALAGKLDKSVADDFAGKTELESVAALVDNKASKADLGLVQSLALGKAEKDHSHAISHISKLQETLDKKLEIADVAAFAKQADVNTSLAALAASVHKHEIADVTNLQQKLDTYATTAALKALEDKVTKVTKDYLPLTGGTLTGTLKVVGGNVDVEGGDVTCNADGDDSTFYSTRSAAEGPSGGLTGALIEQLGLLRDVNEKYALRIARLEDEVKRLGRR